MSRLDTDQADRDELADRRLDRDREREPARLHRHPRCVRPVARGLFQAAVIDSANAAHDYTMRLTCPAPGCLGAIYVPRDSDRERVVCASCQAVLITRRTIDGVDLLIHDRGDAHAEGQ